MNDELTVRSHVGRDILQTAQLFRTPEAAIWEYVVNSIEYVDAGVQPFVHVRLHGKQGEITIADNGRGMDIEGLRQFFTMHGENPDRRRGKRGRGKFGTGKAAAFGIAKRLEVRTVRNGRRNIVFLERDDIERSHGTEISVHWIEQDVATTEPNGTTITISQLLIQRLLPAGIIRNIERHLPFFRALDPVVRVNGRRCEAWRPQVIEQTTFHPSSDQATLLGDVTLTIETAAVPLEEGMYGVAVTTAPGALVAIESAGIERKEFGSYLFGHIECPALEDERYELAPYDASRSLRLNPQHPVAGTLLGFIGGSLEVVRRKFAEERRKRRQEQEFRDLQRQADEIAKILNEDLAEVRERFEELAALQRRGNVARAGAQQGGLEPGAFTEGQGMPGILATLDSPRGTARVAHGGEEPDLDRQGIADPEGKDRVEPRGGDGRSKTTRGGLRVEYRTLGEEAERGHYDAGEKTVLINLDHPAVAAARESLGIDDPAFRRLSYEIAFTTYALGLARELLTNDPELTGDDILYEVRDTLRRITRRAATLYRGNSCTPPRS